MGQTVLIVDDHRAFRRLARRLRRTSARGFIPKDDLTADRLVALARPGP